MSKRKIPKHRIIIAFKVLIMPIFLLIAFGWFAYTQVINILQKEKGGSFLEVEMKPDAKDELKEAEKLEQPKKVEEYEEEENKEDEVVQEEEKVIKSTKQWWEYPDTILQTTRDGNSLLVLVNKKYKLPSSYAPSDLVLAEKSGIRVKSKGTYFVRSVLINDLKELNNAAKADGIDLSVISAYRSYNAQASTYQYWVNYNGGNVAAADTISARPGHSQHQLGTAIDFSSNEIGDRLGSEFDGTQASKWLVNNGYKYGFVLSYPKGYESTTGYAYESWHYRYIGVDNAKTMKDSGKILESWLVGVN